MDPLSRSMAKKRRLRKNRKHKIAIRELISDAMRKRNLFLKVQTEFSKVVNEMLIDLEQDFSSVSSGNCGNWRPLSKETIDKSLNKNKIAGIYGKSARTIVNGTVIAGDAFKK